VDVDLPKTKVDEISRTTQSQSVVCCSSLVMNRVDASNMLYFGPTSTASEPLILDSIEVACEGKLSWQVRVSNQIPHSPHSEDLTCFPSIQSRRLPGYTPHRYALLPASLYLDTSSYLIRHKVLSALSSASALHEADTTDAACR
jgi:hypothetical protein